MDCVLLLCSLAFILLKSCKAVIYTHTWAAHIEGGEKVAISLAEKHGFTYLGKIMDDHYHLKHHHVAKRSTTAHDYYHNNLNTEPQVLWLEQQVVKKRVKRDIHFNDPKWSKMWYLNRGRGLDMNVFRAWEKGHRGRGVVVSILDDGIEKDHPDLRKNYDPEASYDVNSHDKDPQPRYDYTNENRHGTRCAGEVAAEANNGVCNVGVAYEANIGGVRMLDGDVTDAVEAASLSLNPNHIDIYSASWGPDDDGRTVDGPAQLAQKAFRDGIYKGRNGKGSIFVWASGNGGRDQDSCNCDGYTNSIFTLSISSATESGQIPWYSEACSSTLSTTYSSGSGKEHQVITTDLRKGCTETHTGTSASAPLAAGIAALALSANKDLTWRDMQHIVVMTSRPSNLKATDWVTNGFGKRVSHSFGFGLMDASAMVDLALNWTTVPKQHKCTIKSRDSPRGISKNGKVSVSLQSDGCRNTRDEVNYLEHVQAVITLSTVRRGQVQIFLTSPYGTRSTLLTKRPRDMSSEGFEEWAFMTTHNWGEQSHGTWTLEIENNGATYNYGDYDDYLDYYLDSGDFPSTLVTWSLVLYGTARNPLEPPPPPTPPPTPSKVLAKPKLRKSKNIHRHSTSSRIHKSNISNLSHLYPDAINIGPCKPDRPKKPTRRPIGGREPATLNSWSLVMYGTSTDPLIGISQQHPRPHSQDCVGGKPPNSQNIYCLDQCPISFYAANQTTTITASTIPTTTTTTSTTKGSTVSTTPTKTSNSVQPTSGIVTQPVSSTNASNQSKNQSITAPTTVECLPCGEGCEKCVDKDTCITCSNGYNITVNATCVAVQSGIIKYLKEHIKLTFVLITVFLCVLAVIIFLFIFGILQLMEPDSCLHGKSKYSKVNLNGDAESGRKLANLVNGISYNNGTKRLDTQGLLESNSDSDDVYENTFNTKRMNNFS